ncbi:MAG TPA: DHA2 family efflux MFS transporter permease subunit [Baekduia sp.]|uniref:DHA2 family efflux MFS transporter permease subunit n=1 Tax=Baekduia sp. TaxID=2600305 RepID=UPI002D7845E4|nr:DHA2 family efflux MFS transporter permease subunit [Baekduia sp.]HET6505697.1 DHA2 family efflux MFS transporter permease subunit [Baekduia sp.]
MSHRARVAAIVSVGVFVASLDLFIVNIAFPDIQRDFDGTSLASLSWVLDAYAIVFAALLVPAGRWADRTGRKRAFLGGLALFTAASAACAAAPSVGVLIAARIVQAAGAAILTPSSLGLLLPEFPPEKRGLAIGLWAAVGGTAAAAGPVIGGLLVELSWRWVFLVNVPVGLAAIAAGARVLREVRDPDPARPDLVGAGVLTAAVATLIAAIVEGPGWGWGDPRVIGLFAAAAILLGAFAARSTRHPVPVVEPALLKVRAFAFAQVAGLFFFIGFSAMLLGSVLWLTEVWGQSAIGAGLKIAPGPATAALFAVAGGVLSARVGPRLVGAAGAALFGLGGVWWATHLGMDVRYAADYLPGMLIGGAGVGLVNPSLAGAATAQLPPTRLATGSAVLTMSRQIGSALGVALLVAVLGTPSPADVVATFQDAWWLMAGAAALASLSFVAVGPPARATADEPLAEGREAGLGAPTPEVVA